MKNEKKPRGTSPGRENEKLPSNIAQPARKENPPTVGEPSTLTILASPTNRRIGAKSFERDENVVSLFEGGEGGAIVKQPAERELWLRHFEVKFGSLEELRDILAELEPLSTAYTIQARVKEEFRERATIRRLLHPKDDDPAFLEDVPGRLLWLDIDDVPVPDDLDVEDPEAVKSYLVDHLGAGELRGSDVLLHLSQQSGMVPGGIKCHLGFLADEPSLASDRLRWAQSRGLGELVDIAAMRPSQPMYVARPVFGEGVEDPMPERLHLIRGERRTVAIEIPEEPPSPPSRERRADDRDLPEGPDVDAALEALREAWAAQPHPFHEVALALASAFMCFGEEHALEMLRRVAPGRVPPRPGELSGAITDTAAKIAAGDAVTGWPSLAERFGDELIDDLRMALGLVDGMTARETDLANAERLVQRHGGDILYVPKSGSWHAWNGKVFEPDETGVIHRRAQSVSKEMYAEALRELKTADDEGSKKRAARFVAWAASSQNAARLRSMVDLATTQPGVPTRFDELDADPWKIVATNGEVDLKKGTLAPHSRASKCTTLAGAAYMDEPTPLWDKFLDQTFGGDAEMIGYLQRCVGYAAYGVPSEEIVVFLHGQGRNGKTTAVTVLKGVLGGYAVSVRPDIFIAERNGLSPAQESERMNLRGRRLAITTELKEGAVLDSGALKEVVSTDEISSKRMRRDRASFKPSHTIIAAVNHRPRITATDTGTWRRLALIPFGIKVPKEDVDLELVDKLLGERDGILHWVVEGCLEWQRRGLDPPPPVQKALEAYRIEEDVVGCFVEERCFEGENCSVSASELFLSYQNWSLLGGSRPLSQRAFGSRLSARGVERKKIRGRVMYSGIGLVPSTSGG